MPLYDTLLKKTGWLEKKIRRCNVCNKKNPSKHIIASFVAMFTGERWREHYYLHDSCTESKVEETNYMGSRALGYFRHAVGK